MPHTTRRRAVHTSEWRKVKKSQDTVLLEIGSEDDGSSRVVVRTKAQQPMTAEPPPPASPITGLPPGSAKKNTRQRPNLQKIAKAVLAPAPTQDIPITPGNLDFLEGDKGTGVVQTHETGLTEDAATRVTEGLGWKPLELTKQEISHLSELSGINIEPAYQMALDGHCMALRASLAPLIPLSQSWPNHDRELLAKSCPIYIHTDLRLARGGDAYWEGGEILTPGTQYDDNGVLTLENGQESDELIRLDLSYVTPEGVNPSGDGGIIHGALAWMDVGAKKPAVFPPLTQFGEWARYKVRAAFSWIAGLQTPIYKEFWFAGGLSGLWVLAYADDDGCRGWYITKPVEQVPKSASLRAVLSQGVLKAITCPILKSDEEQRMVTGVVLQPEITDAQGDIYSEKVIRDAATNFLDAYNKETQLGVQHRAFGLELMLADSWVTPESFSLGGVMIKKGTWLITVKVMDNALWQAVKSGKLTGFSIGGIARVQPL